MFSIYCYFIFVFVLFASVLFADLLAYFDIYFHTDSRGMIVYSPPKLRLKGTRIILLSIHSKTPIFFSSPRLNRHWKCCETLDTSSKCKTRCKMQRSSSRTWKRNYIRNSSTIVARLFTYCIAVLHVGATAALVCMCVCVLQPFAFVFAGKSHFLEPATQHAAPLLPSPLPLMAVSYTVRLKCALIVLLHCLQWHFTAVASRCRVCLRLCSPVCAYLLMRLSNAFYEYFLAVCRFTASNSPALCGPLMPDKLLMLMLLQP